MTPRWTSCSGWNIHTCHDCLPIASCLCSTLLLLHWILAASRPGREVCGFPIAIGCCPVISLTFREPCPAKFIAAESHPWPQLLYQRHNDCGIPLPGEGNTGVSIGFIPFNWGALSLSFHLMNSPSKGNSEVSALLPNTKHTILHLEVTFHFLISKSYENIN